MDFDQARKRMVVEQIERRGVSDRRVLAAMRQIPRDRFVEPRYASQAYNDEPLPIGVGQTISQPYMVALMTEVAQLAGTERVLEIGTGCGYQTAILAQLARCVYSVERIESLQMRAVATLKSLGFSNCFFRIGDGADGWPEEAPFDLIIVTAAMPGIPRPLLGQLSPRGRLVAPVGEEELQSLVKVAQVDGRWQESYFGECRFVKMTGTFGFDS